VLIGLRRRRTLASFDYQWEHLPAGDAMVSDSWFLANVERILSEELLAIEPAWFAGRRVLDAGCGGGRWTVGLLRLGAHVTAVDWSPHALAATAAHAARLAPEAVAAGRLRTERMDLLAPPPEGDRAFDLVFSFGVLHHTGDTRRALANVAARVATDGVLFLYLYGSSSVGWPKRLALAAGRTALAPVPLRAKQALLRLVLPRRDLHQSFDLFSPLINERLDPGAVTSWLHELGFPDVVPTIPHGELFLRACRPVCSARPFRPPAAPPYWFERYSRRS
jgi:SAM-dependent methyltransferase